MKKNIICACIGALILTCSMQINSMIRTNGDTDFKTIQEGLPQNVQFQSPLSDLDKKIMDPKRTQAPMEQTSTTKPRRRKRRPQTTTDISVTLKSFEQTKTSASPPTSPRDEEPTSQEEPSAPEMPLEQIIEEGLLRKPTTEDTFPSIFTTVEPAEIAFTPQEEPSAPEKPSTQKKPYQRPAAKPTITPKKAAVVITVAQKSSTEDTATLQSLANALQALI